jgi:predicted DNA-binding transcriptional regulator AlpA
MTAYLRFNDLRDRGIINNRMTLTRWIKNEGFPEPYRFGPRNTAWAEDEVNAWIESRKK